MNRLSTSVAICTYNGLKHLPEQLASIEDQLEPPDQIVVSDDRSTDGTVDYLRRWSRTTKIRTKIIANAEQLGICRNFWQSARHCDGDLIFACDQDDIWRPDKTRVMRRHFDAPEVLLAHSNANLVDGGGRPLGSRLYDTLNLSHAEQAAVAAGDAFEVYQKRNIVTGATMAFRRELLDLASPLPDTWMHDAWLAVNASVFGKTVSEDAATIDYRQHSNNLIGARKHSLPQRIRRFWWSLTNSVSLAREIENQIACPADLLAHLGTTGRGRPGTVERLEEKIAFAASRRALPENGWKRARIVPEPSSVERYRRNLQNPRLEMARDLFNRAVPGSAPRP